MISIQEAAKLLGVSPKTLRLWEQEGKINSYFGLRKYRNVAHNKHSVTSKRALNAVLFKK